MYEDVEATLAFGGGTLAFTGAAVNVEWLVGAALVAVLVGIALLRLAKR